VPEQKKLAVLQKNGLHMALLFAIILKMNIDKVKPNMQSAQICF